MKYLLPAVALAGLLPFASTGMAQDLDKLSGAVETDKAEEALMGQ
jgi:hypothetical protein